MTSRRLFFKAMREDLRHRIWMIALSSLASFLALPVAWLMYVSSQNRYYDGIRQVGTVSADASYLEAIVFLSRFFIVAGGVVAVAGAIVVGLFGFRYVFHKNMVDTYHSIPVKRSTLYGVCWLNGLLIWLVPLLVCLAVTLGMALAYLAGTPGAKFIPLMFSEIGINLLVLTVVFLLVYHLVLTAVMISGNILNTLVSMSVLGFGVISIYGLGVAFFVIYMETFYSANVALEPIVYASPLFSAVYLIYQMKSNVDLGQMGPIGPLLINVCMMALLGGLAWFLYRRRASELAEQGIRNKAFSTGMKFLVGLAAGMAGWLIFCLMVGSPGWGVFGALLMEILVFGIMDIIFSMEFKAFFAHKIQMAVTAVICLVICFCFCGDWLGYDTYLPDREDIAEIAVYHADFSNRSPYSYSDAMEYMLENLHFQDTDAAYAYLERVTDREKGTVSGAFYQTAGNGAILLLPTRVTMKNGRTYYRIYRVAESDLDVILPIFSDQDYLEKNYMIDLKRASDYDMLSLVRAGVSSSTMETVPAGLSAETMCAIAEAYNRDVLEDPATALFGGGTLLARLNFERSLGFSYDWSEDGPQEYSLWIEVYDSMEYTKAALEELGYGKWIQPLDPDEISEIRLYSDIWYDSVMYWESVQEMTDSVRIYYGIYTEGVTDTGKVPETHEMYHEMYYDVEVPSGSSYPVSASESEVYLSITDREEIRELMQYMDYASPMHSYAVFQQGYVVTDIFLDGKNTGDRCYFKMGKLPEKYIQRFEQLFLDLRQN